MEKTSLTKNMLQNFMHLVVILKNIEFYKFASLEHNCSMSNQPDYDSLTSQNQLIFTLFFALLLHIYLVIKWNNCITLDLYIICSS